jgi:hypothetical protein
MMADPTVNVKVEGPVETKPVAGVELPKPTLETTTETHKVEKVTGEPGQLPPPAVIADDAIRKEIARYVIFSDTITCLAILFFLFRYGNDLGKDVLAIIATIVGAIIGYRARDTGTVIGYEFGSSSGSTAKSAVLEKKP